MLEIIANTIKEFLIEQYMLTENSYNESDYRINIFEQYAMNETWYHGSDYMFDSFENFQSKGASALGIFVTDDKSFAELFGEHIYTVDIRYSKPYVISMDKWDDIRLKHAKDTTYFKNMRDKLISRGYDSIFITERQTKVSSGMVFRDANIVVLFDKSQLKIIDVD